MNKKQAVYFLRQIKHRILKNTELYIGDESDSDCELEAIEYAIKKIKQRENDYLVELEFPPKSIKQQLEVIADAESMRDLRQNI